MAIIICTQGLISAALYSGAATLEVNQEARNFLSMCAIRAILQRGDVIIRPVAGAGPDLGPYSSQQRLWGLQQSSCFQKGGGMV